MKFEIHLRNVKESLDVIEECIEKGLVERQRTIGFHASAACIDMLEMLLHKNNLIDPGFVIKHEWLKSKNKIEEKFPFDFPSKKKILDLIFDIEDKRNILCYGKPQPLEILEHLIEKLQLLKEKCKEAGLHEL